ncbi:MAG: PAS domain S-box protein, partial [Alphaproteobacteria bacterium]
MRRAAEALERDSAIIRHLSDAVAVTDLERRIVYHNPAFSRLFGLTPRDALHRRLPPEGFARASMTEDAFARQLGEQIAERGKHAFQLELGPVGEREELVVEGVIVPRRDTSGDQVGYIAVYRDVTEQTRISRRLLRQDRIIAQLSEAVVIADTDCVATDCNEAAERLLGYSRGELIGQHIPSLLYGDPTPGYPHGDDILASLK